MAQQEKDDRLTPELEYKDTRGTVLGYTAAPVPHENRVGSALSDEERDNTNKVVGSPAQGNGITNENLAPVGGMATDSGGTQTTSTTGSTDSGATGARSGGKR